MIELLAIAQYLVLSVTDVFDKFLITKRKIEAVSYTFFTVVTGAVILVAWPWLYARIPGKFVGLDLLAGATFSVAFFVFYTALAEGEVSRVVPFVYGLVPIFDIGIGLITGRNVLTIYEVAAMFLLIPGALLISYKKKGFSSQHVATKILAAFLIALYNAVWQYAAQSGPFLNNLMWNRVGAALILTLPLIIPWYKSKVFATHQVKQKANTSFWFLFKQMLGGGNFIFLSYLYTAGTIAVIDALQGFRYVFLLTFSLFLSRKYKHILDEDVSGHELHIRIGALGLIFLGTIILFLK